ncbi:TolB family protein [Sphaerisporangium perillae]|uniref:TolB family protein n=1 Tax=Sphaerisporangium perillae TaxID=2935860 RepID=UPI00200DA805|nr:DPP IV N-terminal domain-containing protein [Sphaerisporangium perillae]
MKHRILVGAALAAAVTAAFAVPAAASVLAGASVQAGTAARPLTGRAVYFDYKAGKFSVDRYEPGSGFVRIGRPSDNFQFSASPDGRKLAWITVAGKVLVKDGSKITTVAKAPTGGPCATPTWSSDSKQVAFVGKADVVTVVNADGTGRHAAGKTTGVCHLTWSGNGRYLAGYAGTADAVYRLDLRTGRAAKAKGVKLVTHVQSLSPDGRNVIMSPPVDPGAMGDGGWPSSFTPVIVDMVTGRKVPIPVKGRLLGAFYLADGRLVVRVAGGAHHTLVVLDKQGKESQRLGEPAQAKKQGLLQIVP